MNEPWTQEQIQRVKNQRHWLPWYVIAWRLIWWVPTWSVLAVFCVLKAIYCCSIGEGKSAWDNET